MHKPFLQFFTHDIFMLLVNVKIEILEAQHVPNFPFEVLEQA